MSAVMAGVDAVLAHLDATAEASRGRLFELLRIQSVSAQPAHAADCAAAADWVRGQLAGMGFAARVHPTRGHPVVLAHHPGASAGPHLLFYGHYDVQPPDPLDLWRSPPFLPVLSDGPNGPRVVARGAVDDKGQVMTFLEAFRAWTSVTGAMPLPVTVLLEGEEEVGSPNLEAFVEAHRSELAAEVAVISDTNMWDIDTPAITTRLRGVVYTEITLHGPSRDLHSGLYGGSALNPINALTEMLGGLHDADGRVAIPGFYDGVVPVDPVLAAQWEALGYDEAAELAAIGLTAPAGERGVPALQRLWARPTADLNGIWGGYTGAGSKTVIASHAAAKLSFRLVPGQDPHAVLDGLDRFLAARLPAGARVEVTRMSASPGIAVDTGSRFVAAAREVLAEEFGRPAVLNGNGGSIPVVELLRRLLGLDSLLIGFGLDDDQVHSPNEKFELRCFHHGIRSHARLIGRLAGLG